MGKKIMLYSIVLLMKSSHELLICVDAEENKLKFM